MKAVAHIEECTKVIKLSLDGKNQEVVLLEFGIKVHRVIYEHVLTFTVNSSGKEMEEGGREGGRERGRERDRERERERARARERESERERERERGGGGKWTEMEGARELFV